MSLPALLQCPGIHLRRKEIPFVLSYGVLIYCRMLFYIWGTGRVCERLTRSSEQSGLGPSRNRSWARPILLRQRWRRLSRRRNQKRTGMMTFLRPLLSVVIGNRVGVSVLWCFGHLGVRVFLLGGENSESSRMRNRRIRRERTCTSLT